MSVQQLNAMYMNIYRQLRFTYQDKLTHQAVRILQTIRLEKEVHVSRIAETLGVSHNTASEHVKRLIQKGYIKKQRREADERKVYLQLTKQGETSVKQHTELDEEKLAVVMQSLSKEEQEVILAGFQLLEERARKCFSS
ncbi:MarR family transcriptional regulator [Terribacillus sp. 7520-G]|uniref:MarR family winged helix-turn-helix transcriptional regulator n=1 Tax=Terribacillus sp. FSL K6-0262 TaxID=2921447 RepID=UPI001E3BEE66|nr:MarR family transcriptional regulator [Terribacillus sp. 7520-G]